MGSHIRTGVRVSDSTLIVGAGPTGLAAAVELRRLGYPVRIVEKRLEREPLSKAFGINPKTLSLLEAAEITPRLLMEGYRVEEARIHAPNTETRIRIDRMNAPYRFLLVLAQHRTESILEQRLKELGVEVERGCELITVRPSSLGLDCELRHSDGTMELAAAPRMLAADGAKSDARKSLGLGFPGSTLSPEWSLADLELACPLDPSCAHIFLAKQHVLFVLRLEGSIWRIISPMGRAVDLIPKEWSVLDTKWESWFTVSHRVIERFEKTKVYFAGDAATIHSPFGARGMNLGIEDACAFARLLQEDRLDTYAAERRARGEAVVKQIRRRTQLTISSALPLRFARSRVLPWLAKLPILQRMALPALSGFD